MLVSLKSRKKYLFAQIFVSYYYDLLFNHIYIYIYIYIYMYSSKEIMVKRVTGFYEKCNEVYFFYFENFVICSRNIW
jgi:hypothetical protein